ncbi:MAG: hypothetical protein K2K75_12915 [Muribaculaceae bacterium]|nr:hypothetical protein [Muribaculaceae bacterium]
MIGNHISILGKAVDLIKRPSDKLKGINMGEKLTFDFFDGFFKGEELLFVKPKGVNPTPKKCAIISERLMQLFGIPVVFILAPGPGYERQRLLEKNVYFIMSDKYANLPMLVAMEKVTSRKIPDRLTPVAQYILLYHLEIENINGKSTKAIASLMPYSYESVSIGLTCLADVGLCEKVAIDVRSNAIRFKSAGKLLWEEAGKYLIDPVEKKIYCDALNAEKKFPVCGINALAHYSMLNRDPEKWIMMTSGEYRQSMSDDYLVNPNEFDGDIIIEIWKYPVVSNKNNTAEWVDPLSLVLSMKKDYDPRVEEEIEQIISNFKWLV